MGVIARQVHGVPLWLIKEYLLEMGGDFQEDGHITGEGWEAKYKRVEDFRIGSLVIGAVYLEIEGEDGVLSEMQPVLDLKLMRGGG